MLFNIDEGKKLGVTANWTTDGCEDPSIEPWCGIAGAVCVG